MRLDPLEERHRERERAKREAQERERREHEGERTFGRLVELWLAAHGQPNKRPSSQETDRSILKCHLLPRFASMPVTALTKADVRTMMAEMQAAKIAIQANRLAGVAQRDHGIRRRRAWLARFQPMPRRQTVTETAAWCRSRAPNSSASVSQSRSIPIVRLAMR